MTPLLTERLIALTHEEPERESLRLIQPGLPDVVLTRRGLLQAVKDAAAQLAASGVSSGQLVVIVQRDMLTLVSTFLGASLLGAVPSILPFATEKLDPARYRASMKALIEVSRPSLLATDPIVVQDVLSLMPETGSVESMPGVLAVETGKGNPSFVPEAAPTQDPEAIALLQHSSGTTGLQKGVALCHRAIFDQIAAYSKALDFTQADVVVSWLPLYHDMGLIAGFLMPLLTGARLVMMSPFEWVRAPHLLMQAISAQHGTLCWLPNFAYNFCAQKIRDQDLEQVDLSSMRAFINCSEPAYESSHKQFIDRFGPLGVTGEKLAVCYAMAETVFAVSQTSVGQPARVDAVDRQSLRGQNLAQPADPGAVAVDRIVSTGRPIAGMQVRVLGPGYEELPERHVGELAVRSPYMLTGYYHREDATTNAFHDGWYLTGDIGYLADGEVFVLGRKKDLLIVGGRNVYPQDLEALASTVQGVHPGRVAVFGIVNPDAGTEDAALVAEVDTTHPEEMNMIRVAIRRAVAGGSDIALRYIWLVPRGWLIKTSSGKVARLANRDKLLQENSALLLSWPAWV